MGSSESASSSTLADTAMISEGHQRLFPVSGEPSFLDELETAWGARWGARDEVGTLRKVMVRQPSPELAKISEDAWSEEYGALIDPDRRWYWFDRKAPDLDLVHEQHQGLIAQLRDEGIEVVVEEPIGGGLSKDVFIRDPLTTVPGGAVITRMAVARLRRGEEAAAALSVAQQGMPILGTIVGTGTLEGGSIVKLDRNTVALGTGIRCNAAGADQLAEILGRVGMELITVPLPDLSMHLDSHLAMVGVRRALVRPTTLPDSFRDDLRARGFELIDAHPDEPWGLNLLCLRENRVLTAIGAPRTAETLERHGIDVIAIPYDELHKNGGGVHCSTMELVRDPAE